MLTIHINVLEYGSFIATCLRICYLLDKSFMLLLLPANIILKLLLANLLAKNPNFTPACSTVAKKMNKLVCSVLLLDCVW